MARPLIAFLSDFGTRDHYVGVIRGVILSTCPDVTLVDISHDIPPHDIAFAARELEATYRYFPPGTIFLVVVDPGVGTTRLGLAAEAGEYRFVAPDNGVLSGVFRDLPPKKIVELSERRYARPTVSRTFEGRDRFAPAAAFLAKGVHLTALGRSMADYQRLDLARPELEDGVIRGSVVRVDRFGNLVTNLDRRTCERLTEGTGGVHLSVGGRSISRIVSTYADIPPGEVGALFGSTDHLECAAQADSAAERLGVGVGESVELRRT
jgi:S-adenosylmethionine hydrolase